MNGSRLMIDPNKDVNEVCAIVLAGKQNGCVILGGGSPKNFYLQAQPTLWEVYGIPKGGNDYFIQITYFVESVADFVDVAKIPGLQVELM